MDGTVDFYGVPEYVVTRCWSKPAGIAGCIRVYAVCERDGQVFPLYTAVMDAVTLVMARRDAVDVSLDFHMQVARLSH